MSYVFIFQIFQLHKVIKFKYNFKNNYFSVKINEEDIDLIYDEIIEKIDDEDLTFENYKMLNSINPEIFDFFDIFNNKILENMHIVINKQIISRLNGLYESFNKVTDKLHNLNLHKNGLTLSISNFIERSIKNKSLLNNIGFNRNNFNDNNSIKNDIKNTNSKCSNHIFSISRQLKNEIFSDEEIFMDSDYENENNSDDDSKKSISYNENDENNINKNYIKNIERIKVNENYNYKEKNIMVNNINNINNIHISNNNITNLNDIQILSNMNNFNLNSNNNSNNNNMIKLNPNLPPIYNFDDSKNDNKKSNDKNYFISVKINKLI
jgi:hypothetical protein